MNKIFIIIFFSFLNCSLSGQNISEKQKIKKMISVFFEGLHEGDSSKVSSVLHSGVKIQTTYKNKKGKSVLKDQTRQELLKAIALKKKETIYFEKLISYDIKVDDNLALVWTPYEFYLNEKFSHCGTNSFQLFKQNEKWKIIFLIDTRKRKNCKIN